MSLRTTLRALGVGCKLILVAAFCAQIPALAHTDDTFTNVGEVDLVSGIQKIVRAFGEKKPTCPDHQLDAKPPCRTYIVNFYPASESAQVAVVKSIMDDPVKDPYAGLLTGPSWASSGEMEDATVCVKSASFRDLRDVVHAISGIKPDCDSCIRELNIISHGAPGLLGTISDMVYVTNRTNLVFLGEMDKATLQRRFTPGAVIRLLGCAIGQGETGEDFLKQFGLSFLGRNGGEVRAFTENSITNPFSHEGKSVAFSFGDAIHYIQPPGSAPGRFTYDPASFLLPVSLE